MGYLKVDVCIYSSYGSLITTKNIKQFLNKHLPIIFDFKAERNQKQRPLLYNNKQY